MLECFTGTKKKKINWIQNDSKILHNIKAHGIQQISSQIQSQKNLEEAWIRKDETDFNDKG